MNRFILFFTLTSFVSINYSFSQTIDFAEFARYISPPQSTAYLVKNASGDEFVERLENNPQAEFNGQTVLELKSVTINNGIQMEIGSAFIQINPDSIALVGTSFTEETLGSVSLPFNPPIELSRSLEIGALIEESVDASVMLGPIPANVTITVTYDFLGLETVAMDFGTFTDALKIRTTRTLSLSGVPLVVQDRTEWHHPSASLIKFEDNGTGNVGELFEIVPDLPPSNVDSWSLH